MSDFVKKQPADEDLEKISGGSEAALVAENAGIVIAAPHQVSEREINQKNHGKNTPGGNQEVWIQKKE